MARKPRSGNLAAMAEAPAQAAPDLLGAEMAPHEDQRGPWLPQPCPVTPLGVLGDKLVFLDQLQQVIMGSPECRKGETGLWFGHDYLETYFAPEGGSKERWDQRLVQKALQSDCVARGIFNPLGKVLGRGAHKPKSEPESLVLHTGRWVLISRPNQPIERHPPGRVTIGGKDLFFPASDPLPIPAKTPATRADGQALLDRLQSWNWADAASPLLLLGWIAQAFICGALDWRAHMLIPGPTASGKSSLQKIVRAVVDYDWVVATADATEASIRQILRNDTLPVSIDEAEKHDNPEKLQAILNLMKKASSGDKILRGGADHKGTEFTAQSCFLMSCVLHATLRGEDRNRIVVAELLALPQKDGEEPLDLELARWNSMGRRLQRRMIEQWPRFDRTYAAYRREIGARRYQGRWQDTFGTLLACADMLLYDHAPGALDAFDDDGDGDRVTEAVAAILPLMAKGKVEAKTDTERAIAHLLSKALPGAGGQRAEPVGTWLDRAMMMVTDEAGFEGPDRAARAALKSYGLRVVELVNKAGKPGIQDVMPGDDGWKRGYLAVAYSTNAALQDLWRGTEWSGDGYLQSLRKIEGTRNGLKVRFGSAKADNALLVPLDAFQGDEG